MKQIRRNTGLLVFTSVSDMQGFAGGTGLADGEVVYLSEDGLSGEYKWSSSSAATHDGVDVIKITAITTGRFLSAKTYNQGGIGASDRTQASKNQESPSVKDFGAAGDGIADDTAAIQKAIDWAESQITNIASPYVWTTPSIYLPSGACWYQISGTLTVTKPIRIYGDGSESSIIRTSADTPVLSVEMDTAQTYNRPIFENFGIIGTHSDWADTSWESWTQHGIKVVPNSSAVADSRVSIRGVDIHRMKGNGVYLNDKTNTVEILNCRIQVCANSAVYMDGGYNTNFRFLHSEFRENRIGIRFNPDSSFTSGTVSQCLIESNRQGDGVPGSTHRPCVGVWMKGCNSMTFTDNYIENHLNDFYFETACNFNRIEGNYMATINSFNLVGSGLYDGPPARKFGMYWESSANGNGNSIIFNNFASKPSKPSAVTDAQWNSATWGRDYEHVTDSAGKNYYGYNRCTYYDDAAWSPDTTYALNDAIYNGSSVYICVTAGTSASSGGPTGTGTGITDGTAEWDYQSGIVTRIGKLTVTNPSNRHNIVNYENDITDGSARGYDALYAYRQRQEFGGHRIERGPAQTIKETDILLNPSKEIFNFTGNTVSSHHTIESQLGALHRITPLGDLYRTWSDSATGSVKWSYGTAAPTTGAHTLGEIVFDNTPSAGGFVGWICTSGGTPGTWKTFGAISV